MEHYRPIITPSKRGSISPTTARGAARFVKALKNQSGKNSLGSQATALAVARLISALKLKPNAITGAKVHRSKNASNSQATALAVARLIGALKPNAKIVGGKTYRSKNSSHSFGFNFGPAMAQPKVPKQSFKTKASKSRRKPHR